MSGESRLPDSWSSVPLANLGRWYGGGTPSKSIPSYWEGGTIPWVSPKDMKVQHIYKSEDYITEAAVDSSSTNLIPKHSVLLVTRSGILRHSLPVAVTKVVCTINQDLKALVLYCGINPDYVAYALRAYQTEILAQTAKSGTTVQSIDFSGLLAYKIPLAPTAEQARITEEIERHLTRLDATVASLERVQANLKRYRAAVLKAACEGRLVPTEADLAWAEGRGYVPASQFLDEVPKESPPKPTGVRRSGKSKFAVQPTLPELPEGWAWATWSQIGSSQNGRAFPSSEYSPGGVKLLRPGNLSAVGSLSWTPDNTRYLPESWANAYQEFLIGENELVINLTAQSLKDEFLGRVCLTSPGERCLLNQRLARLTPRRGVSSRYLLWVFKSPWFRRFVDELNTGSLIQHMFTWQLDSFPIPLPPIAEQERIAIEVERRFSIFESIEASLQLQSLRSPVLRASILQKAFEGRLVPQDLNDEPASALLERIRQAKAAQPSKPRVKNEKAKPALAPSPSPPPSIGAHFEPPKGASAYSPGREPRVESAPLIPKPPEGATALSPRRGLGNQDDPHTRGSRPGLRAGAPSGGSKLASTPRPPVRAEEAQPVAEPDPQEADFLELPRDEQVDIAWEALLGQGTLEKDVAIRTVADELRNLDLARFKRLRQDGPLYGAIAAAIEKGVREGDFDRPRRGCVRAVLLEPKDYTDEVWQRCLLAVVGPEPADVDATLRAAAEWARETMGLDYARLREDGVILTGLREALEDEVRAGRIVRRGGTIRRATD